MIRLLALSLAFLSVLGVRYDGYHQVEVGPLRSEAEAEIIDQLVDKDERLKQVILINDHIGLKAPTSLLIAPNYVKKVQTVLENRSFPYQISVTDFQQSLDADKAENDAATSVFLQRMADGIQEAPTAFLRYDDMVTWLTNTAANSPGGIARTFTVGTSFEGRTIVGMEINHNRLLLPLVWLDAGIHAREWAAPSTALYIIDRILFGTDADAVALRDNYRWVIAPELNPDGYEYSHTGDRMWRKTRQQHPGYICVGVDPNRNFDVNFGGPGTSANGCSDTFKGPAPFSEPETAAVRDQLLARNPGTDLNMYISLHSYSQYWLTPYGSYQIKPTDYTEIERVGNLAAAAILATHGRSFVVGTPPDILYQAAGGSFDWAKKVAEIKYSYTPELRPNTSEPGFRLPAVEITPCGEEIFAGVAASVLNANL